MISPMVRVPVGGNGRDLRDFLAVLDLLGDLAELGDGGLDGLVDAALERIGLAPAVTFETFAVDGLGQHGRGRGAVARDVAGLAGDFADHLGAHVFIRIFEFDFLGDGHTVLGDGRGAEFLVEDDVAAFRSERGLDGAREFLDAAQKRLPRVLIK